MQIRCHNCHRPFALSREGIHHALDVVTEQNLHHYNAPCPHCSKTNRVSRQDLQRAAPDWEYKPAEEEKNE